MQYLYSWKSTRTWEVQMKNGLRYINYQSSHVGILGFKNFYKFYIPPFWVISNLEKVAIMPWVQELQQLLCPISTGHDWHLKRKKLCFQFNSCYNFYAPPIWGMNDLWKGSNYHPGLGVATTSTSHLYVLFLTFEKEATISLVQELL